MAIELKLPEIRKSNKKKAADGGGAGSAGGLKVTSGGKGGKGGRAAKGKMPTKNYINVMIRSKQTFSMKKHLPLVIIAAVLILVLGKFFVVDRLTATAREANRVAEIQQELTIANSKISSLQELDDLYAHYTYADMTAEELSRVDRVAAMKLIDEAFLSGNISRSWNLTGNVMTLQVNGPSLSDLNQLASELEVNPIVERCVISSADKRLDEDGNVSVTFVIYLQQPWSAQEEGE